ncbi:MAG TPA: ATP-binding protein, partial [Dehalococcoidia bacterium]|nr:ATP-binding protein [Dehalococcoidia bacterium]
MNGPHRTADARIDQAGLCPVCGQPRAATRPATVIDARIEVGQNQGDVRAVEAKVVHGDVLTNVHQAQIYVLSEAGRDAGWHRFLSTNTPPYKFLASYTAQDRVLFKGREAEIAQITRRIAEQPVLVVSGEPGIGKTSLLAAGVVPALIDRGAMVVHFHDYHDPVGAIRGALEASSDQLAIPLPDGTSLPAIIRAVTEATRGSLVLIFDQLESLFEPGVSPDWRSALLDQIVASRRAVAPEYLRWIFVSRGDTLHQLVELQDRMPDLLQGAVHIGLLGRDQAMDAIEGPLRELGYPVSFVGDLVPMQLIPDLDDLTPDAPGIQPAHLQIVCHCLYQRAVTRQPPHIDVALYNDAKGADGIIDGYLDETLRSGLAGDRRLAERVLAELAEPHGEPWTDLDALIATGEPAHETRQVAEWLVRVGLILKRSRGDRVEYSLAIPTLADELRRLIGATTGRLFQAEDEVERIWSTWLARGSLPTRAQLRYLTALGGRLRLQPVKALLLLQAAVARQAPVAPWIAALGTPEGRALIWQLEDPPSVESVEQAGRSVLDKAARLLGLRGDDAVAPPPPGARGHGAVAWSAVHHPDTVIRQTAALALLTLDRHEALDRLAWALRGGLRGLARRRRRAEVWATLLDADPEIGRLDA